ncbi:MAG: ATP-binding cassette domain-containing protein [Bacteroidetes bacterium]|nr:ATP-binding cassette domain-containing protein [Bacteroidota bacterium]
MIKLEQVSKIYSLSKKQQQEQQTNSNSIAAVDRLSFGCQPGRIFSLLGPNGAGKTTTLRMIATLLQPSSGSIVVDGFDTQTQGQEVRRSIGFLTGSTHLYERLTPEEIVKYFADLHQVAPADFNRRKDELFTQLGINSFRKKRIGQLSTGMKQKVSIARTMIHNPSVVIFDEPTSGLDVITAANIINLIRTCKEEGKTVIFSSHIMSEVDLLCDELAIIHKGQLVYSDTMEAFRNLSSGKSLTETFINIVTGQ